MALSLFLAVLIGWCSASQLLAQTPAGIHCPTAPVQAISVAAKKTCCANEITLVRKPRLGDKDFVQCRCAEKRSAQQQGDLDRNGPHQEMLALNPVTLELPLKVPEAIAERPIDARLASAYTDPLIPPPAAVA